MKLHDWWIDALTSTGDWRVERATGLVQWGRQQAEESVTSDGQPRSSTQAAGWAEGAETGCAFLPEFAWRHSPLSAFSNHEVNSSTIGEDYFSCNKMEASVVQCFMHRSDTHAANPGSIFGCSTKHKNATVRILTAKSSVASITLVCSAVTLADWVWLSEWQKILKHENGV